MHFRIPNVQFIVQNMAEGSAFLSCAAPENYPRPAQLSTGFLKPGSDDEDSVPVCTKRSRPVKEVDSVKKQQENEMSPKKKETSNKSVDNATATLERYCSLR